MSDDCKINPLSSRRCERGTECCEVEHDSSLAAPAGSAAVAREKRQWWAVADCDVREVTGYSCAPSNPTTWWCPEVGFSGSEGHHLFKTQDEAFAKAIEECERDLIALQKRLNGLKRRRQNSDSTTQKL